MWMLTDCVYLCHVGSLLTRSVQGTGYSRKKTESFERFCSVLAITALQPIWSWQRSRQKCVLFSCNEMWTWIKAFQCVTACVFSPQPHLCDPGLHLDSISCYLTRLHNYPANHFAAYPAERNAAHCHGNHYSILFDNFHYLFPIMKQIIFSNANMNSWGSLPTGFIWFHSTVPFICCVDCDWSCPFYQMYSNPTFNRSHER